MFQYLRVIIGLIMCIQHSVYAVEHQVKMRHHGIEGDMVFEPGFLKTNVGDVVKFVPINQDHNSVSHYSPDGGPTWKGGIDETITVTLTQGGVYLYKCTAHLQLGMVGIIQVGKVTQAEFAKVYAAAQSLKADILANKKRLDNYLKQIQQD